MTKYRVCRDPDCGYKNNLLNQQKCAMCGESLITDPNLVAAVETEKKTIGKGSKNKRNLIIAAIALSLAGLGVYNRTLPVVIQAEAPTELPSGTLRYWGPPCSERLMSQKIARAVSNSSHFNILRTDVDRNRDAIAELIDKQISLVLHEKAQFPQHLAKAKAKGVELKGIPYAVDGIAYLTNAKIDNIDYLTLEQLEKIYRGEITNWKEVGGADVTIQPILLSGLGRNSLFLNFKGKLNPNNIYVKNRKTAISALKENPGALFYTSATLAPLEKNVQIIPLQNEFGDIISPVIGDRPNQQAFKDGSYPQIRTLFAIRRKDDRDREYEMVTSFIDYLTSPQGQVIVKENGFVPLYQPL